MHKNSSLALSRIPNSSLDEAQNPHERSRFCALSALSQATLYR
ncbi:MAG: hypothetical protein OQK61_07930 [Ignavibacteriaceae bacterium]|nr:hypothetical protein [Ignavibacteriaceae bacterium]